MVKSSVNRIVNRIGPHCVVHRDAYGVGQWWLTSDPVWTNLLVFGGATTVANTSLGCPGAPTDLLYLPLFLGEGGCGRPREKVALLLAGRTEILRGLMGGGGG